MVPNFILAGAMKSGTTFLHNLLENHPQISIIDRDMDYAYFDDDRIFKRGKDWYLSLFEKELHNKKEDTFIGQTSADCNFNPGSIQRILDHNPGAKLIFVLRHPIDRAYSLYWHQYGMGREYRKFEHAIKVEPTLITKSYHNFKHYSYIERSRYNKQFQEVLKLVAAENLLFMDFESLVKEPLATTNIVLEFLGANKVNDLRELNFTELPTNPAKIPTNHAVVVLSVYLQNMGMIRIGRRILNLFREESRPPKMNEETRKLLEIELKEDIVFFEKVQSDFASRIKTTNI